MATTRKSSQRLLQVHGSSVDNRRRLEPDLDWTVRARSGGAGNRLDVPESATVYKAHLDGQLGLKGCLRGTNLERTRLVRDPPELGHTDPGSERPTGTRHSTLGLGALHVRHLDNYHWIRAVESGQVVVSRSDGLAV